MYAKGWGQKIVVKADLVECRPEGFFNGIPSSVDVGDSLKVEWSYKYVLFIKCYKVCPLNVCLT